MSHVRRRLFWTVLVSGWIGAVGCSSNPNADARGPLEPADFAAAGAASMPTHQDTMPPSQPPDAALQTHDAPVQEKWEDERSQWTSDAAAQAAPSRRHTYTYTVDAMVGQVNGQPIYANTVLEPIMEQLAALGGSLPLSEFRLQAHRLIEGRLGQMVADSLILGEAEGDLSAQEQVGLQNVLKQQREELIRFWGKGSLALAEETLIRQTSRNLDQTLTETRQRLLVQRYLRQKLWPKIHVTRKDIKRYYSDHIDQYNPPPSRTLRLIYVEDETVADQVDQLLVEGKTFQEVASLPLNQYRPGQNGLMSKKAVGDQVFGHQQLNDAMLRLNAGGRSQRIVADDKYWWIHVDAIDEAENRSLSQVQLEIEQLLRRQQFQTLTQRYREELFVAGSYHPIDLMSQVLLKIAVSRFAAN